MGRMNPAPLEATLGSSAGAVAHQWREHDRTKALNCGERYRNAYTDAETFLEQFPEFASTDGKPCVYAIDLLVQLRTSGRDGLTRTSFRTIWLRYLSHPRRLDYVREFLPHLTIAEPAEATA